MIKYLLIALIVAVVLYEIIEHVLIPLIGHLISRNKRAVCGAEGMVGKIAEVREWNEDKGQVLVNGELWEAHCGVSMLRGDKAIIRDIEGLTLKVEPFENL